MDKKKRQYFFNIIYLLLTKVVFFEFSNFIAIQLVAHRELWVHVELRNGENVGGKERERERKQCKCQVFLPPSPSLRTPHHFFACVEREINRIRGTLVHLIMVTFDLSNGPSSTHFDDVLFNVWSKQMCEGPAHKGVEEILLSPNLAGSFPPTPHDQLKSTPLIICNFLIFRQLFRLPFFSLIIYPNYCKLFSPFICIYYARSRGSFRHVPVQPWREIF